MKKVLLIAAAAMLLLSMTSCNKDKEGVYNPKQKISVIYEQSSNIWEDYDGERWIEDDFSSYTKLHKSQEWTWDGKLLKQIKGYTNEGVLSYTQTFTYEKKKLTRVDYVDAEDSYTSYATFEYDGKLLTKASLYGEGLLWATCEYTHTDKKITNITYTGYDYDKGSSMINATKQMAMLRMTLPQGQISRSIISEQEAKMKSRKEIEFIARITLTWTDNNITTVTTTYDGYTDSDINSFTYDTKKNPYHLYMDENSLSAEDGSGLMFLNENNILTARYYYDNQNEPGSTTSRTYTYTYDNNDYPVSCTYCSKYSNSTNTYRTTYTRSTTYEYLK